MKIIKKLKGHSGCDVLLLERNKKFFIRKVSKNLIYNNRLICQIEKQILFNHPIIKTPEIINVGYINQLYYADMDYIPGVLLSEYIQNNSISSTLKIINTILDNRIKHKAEVNKNTLSNKAKKIIEETKDLNVESKKFLLKFLNYNDVPSSYCHGDLSLENIIIYNDNIYLIDFLDLFCNTYLMDVSKIFMDLIYGWSWRSSKNTPYVKNKIILDYLVSKYSKKELKITKDFIGLHLLRILPYTKEKKDKLFIKDSLHHCINYLLL